MFQSEFDRDVLLAQCSVLRRLNRDLLCEVLGCGPATADALLAGAEIEAFEHGYRLRPAAAAAAYERLCAEGAQAEAAAHQRAFLAYLARMQRGRAGQRPPDDEDECLYHLDALYIHLATQMAWRTMRRFALLTLRTGPVRPMHRRRLMLFAGVAAVYLQKYTHGDRYLSKLLTYKNNDPDIIIKAIKGLADGSWFRSRYDEALVRYDQLYQVAHAAGDRTYEGLALLNRSIVFHELQAYDRALEDCERSLTIFRALGDARREAHALYHTALFTLHLGRWDAARRYCNEAQIQFERLGMHAYLGFIYWCQGLLAHIFDDEAASAAAYHRSLTIAEAAGDEQPSLALDARVNLGVLAHAAGHHAQALAHYDRALAYALRLDRQHQVCLIQFRRGQILERLGRPGRAFLAYRSAIGGVEHMGGATTREDVKIILLGTTQQIYEAMVLRCLAFYEQGGDFAWAERALGYIERARSRAFLDALAQKEPGRPAVAAESAAPALLGEIQAALPADALLIEYFTTGVTPHGEHLISRIPSGNRRLREILALPPQTVAFAISRDRCVLFRPRLNPNGLRPQAGESLPGRHLLLGPMPVNLYQQLIAPAAALLAGKRLLYLVPHGPLHYVPFAALRTPAGASLLDPEGAHGTGGLALAQAPSATILVRTCLRRPPAQGMQALALGFNDPQGAQPLRFAEAEATHIAGLLGGAAHTGDQPKRAVLRQAGQDLCCLHIAGHALFTPRDPLGSWLLLGEGDRLSAREIIDSIDLGADLVTLSSCTSGISHVVPGDELLGLSRALLFAGAATVVCTRWEAVDIVALLVMDRFYAELPSHSPAVALRNAQVAVRDLTVAQVGQIAAGWVAQGGALAEAIGDPAQLLDEIALAGRQPAPATELDAATPLDPDARPFAAPLLWAPFMVIGRG